MTKTEFNNMIRELNDELSEKFNDELSGSEEHASATLIVPDDDTDPDGSAPIGKYLRDFFYLRSEGRVEVSYEILSKKLPYLSASELKERLKQEIAEQLQPMSGDHTTAY